MQSNTTSKEEKKPVKEKDEIKKEISNEKPVNEGKVKVHISKEIKCSIIDGGVNYII